MDTTTLVQVNWYNIENNIQEKIKTKTTEMGKFHVRRQRNKI
jgi:hypothetical protein